MRFIIQKTLFLLVVGDNTNFFILTRRRRYFLILNSKFLTHLSSCSNSSRLPTVPSMYITVTSHLSCWLFHCS